MLQTKGMLRVSCQRSAAPVGDLIETAIRVLYQAPDLVKLTFDWRRDGRNWPQIKSRASQAKRASAGNKGRASLDGREWSLFPVLAGGFFPCNLWLE